MSESGIVNIRGKEYRTVALRVAQFREKHPAEEGWGILTEVLQMGSMVIVKATITHNGNIIAMGHGEEERDSSNINKTSALENCETSAIGRALAALGLAGTEYASANEVSDAILKQQEKEMQDKYVKHVDAVKRNLESIEAYETAIATDDYDKAVEAWFEIERDDAVAIYSIAPTKGGFLSTKARQAMKSDEFNTARQNMTEAA